MFALIHDMRTRIITSDAFTGDRIIGAILFEDTVFRRSVRGEPTASYLWNEKNIVPFLKIDQGLEAEKRGVRLMKPIPDLAETLARCGRFHLSVSTQAPPPRRGHRLLRRRGGGGDGRGCGRLARTTRGTNRPTSDSRTGSPTNWTAASVGTAVVERRERATRGPAIARAKASQGADIVCGWAAPATSSSGGGGGGGTEARPVVRAAEARGVREICRAQFAIAAQVIAAGLAPIIEPELAAHQKAAASLEGHRDFMPSGSPRVHRVPATGTLPEDPRAYDNSRRHPRGVMGVCAVWADTSAARVVRAEARGVSGVSSARAGSSSSPRDSTSDRRATPFGDALERNVSRRCCPARSRERVRGDEMSRDARERRARVTRRGRDAFERRAVGAERMPWSTFEGASRVSRRTRAASRGESHEDGGRSVSSDVSPGTSPAISSEMSQREMVQVVRVRPHMEAAPLGCWATLRRGEARTAISFHLFKWSSESQPQRFGDPPWHLLRARASDPRDSWRWRRASRPPHPCAR